MKKAWISVLFLVVWLAAAPSARAFIMINEILAEPPKNATGDANADGVLSSGDDEFIELFNPDGLSVDLSGWYLTDKIKTRHIFDTGVLFDPNGIMVVFGGGTPNIGGINGYTASTGSLSLNNSGDVISLFDQNGALINSVTYGKEADKEESLTRSPEGEGESFVLHSTLPQAQGRAYSAGYFTVPPAVIPEEPAPGPPPDDQAVVPEAGSILYLTLGIGMLWARELLRFSV